MKKKHYLAAGAVLAALAVPFGWAQNNALTVSRYEYASEKVGRELDGFTIVQISDLHNHRFGAGQSRLLEAAAGLGPDLVVITGDVVDCHRTDLAPALELVRGLAALAPVYYVTGNHEWVLSSQVRGELLAGLEEAGAVILENRTVSIRSGEGGFTLLGLSDKNLTDGTLEELMEGVPAGELAVLLAHQPQHWDRYAAAGADLVFSGHAHGGQVRLPLAGGLYAPGQGVLPALTEGVRTAGGSALVISRGLGNSTFPLRLFNRPEVVALTLRAE